MELIHFTLAHFNQDVQKLMLCETGYTSLNDYELHTSNSLFELSWNSRTGLFESEASALRAHHIQNEEVYCRYIPMSSLSADIKDYLYHTYLAYSKYRCFEDYFINNYRQLVDILVYVPYRYRRSVVATDTSVQITVHDNTKVEEPVEPLSGFYFFINGSLRSTRKTYILRSFQVNDMLAHPERYTKEGWHVSQEMPPMRYREKLDGFVVSRKYKDLLRKLGAEYIPKTGKTVKE